MRKFRFRFEPVLRHRETLERLRLQALAVVQARMTECDRNLKALAQAYDSNLGYADVSVGTLIAREHYLDSLITQMDRIEELKISIGFELDEARLAAVAAQQAREVMEKLKERHRQEHRKEFEAVEQSQLDEVAAQRAERVRRAQEGVKIAPSPERKEYRYEFTAA